MSYMLLCIKICPMAL
uniref:Uncharacterized protein n=1 Tax=Rhizophora mucronata TaxID=61149 RepID=A0A2P2P4S6_RHIMU